MMRLFAANRCQRHWPAEFLNITYCMVWSLAAAPLSVDMKPAAERPPKQFACRYFHDDAWWGLTITAYDWDDAANRANKLGVQLDGEIGAIIPAAPGVGIVVRVWTALRNFLKR